MIQVEKTETFARASHEERNDNYRKGNAQPLRGMPHQSELLFTNCGMCGKNNEDSGLLSNDSNRYYLEE
jgi:hypothetical protein